MAEEMRWKYFSDDRDARLGRSLSGTNLALAGDYNQRIVLQSIRRHDMITRSQLVAMTGLTAPTIMNITRRLLEQGLIVNCGRTEGARGQPAMRFMVNADGCHAFGVNIDRDQLTVVLLDLAGRVRALRRHDEAFLLPEAARSIIAGLIRSILDETGIDVDRIIGLGVAVPDDLGKVPLRRMPEGYAIWTDTDVGALLRPIWSGPLHIDNDAAAAAIGEAQFGLGLVHPSFFYILVMAGLGGGVVLDGVYHRGAAARSGELGFLPHGDGMLQDVVSLSGLRHRLGGAETAADREVALEGWLDDAALALVPVVAAINCLINPDAILIGGGLDRDVAARLIRRIQDMAGRTTSRKIPAEAALAIARIYDHAAAIGAAILPFLDQLLPTEGSLMKRPGD